MADVDIAVFQDEFGKFDIEFGEDGDFVKTEGFDTAISMSIFCERRATAAEVLSTPLRRGWWGNVAAQIDDFEIGSKLWLIRQERLTPEILNRIKDFINRGLAWMIDDEFAVDIAVDVTGRNGTATATVTLVRPNGQVERRGFDIWQETGVSA